MPKQGPHLDIASRERFSLIGEIFHVSENSPDLPFLCHAAYSLPLEVGERWVWSMIDHDSGKSFLRSARILDAKAISQGRLWTIAVRDSAERKEDTGTIMAWPDGRQQWLRPSALLPIELQAPSGEASTESGAIVESDTLSPWGQVSTFPGLGRGYLIQRDDSSLTWKDSSRSYWWRRISKPLPHGEWSAKHGLERMICYPDGLSGREWALIQHNGRNVFQPMPSIRIPAPGAHLVWTMAKSIGSSFANLGSMHPYGTSSGATDKGTLRWDILERKLDSSGWIRLKIQEGYDLSRDRFESAFGTYQLPGPNTTSNYTILNTISIDLRIQRDSGWTRVSKAPAFPFHLAWISRWYNRIESRNSNPVPLSAKELNIGGKETTSEHVLFQMGMDSAFLLNSKSSKEFGFSISSGDWAMFRLVESNLPPEPITENVREVVRSFPEATIRWSTAAGRTGTLTASEIVQRPAALRGKTLFLLARLPDGRLWQGTHVVP